MDNTSKDTTREDALLAFFGDLPLNLQQMVLCCMHAIERTERYRMRCFGFRFEGFVREASARELYHNIERWWQVRNNVLFAGQHLSAHLRPIEDSLLTCVRAIANQVFVLDNGDGLNLTAAEWRHSVVGSLRMEDRIRAGGEADNWLDQIRLVTADGRHHIAVMTANIMRDEDHDSESDDDEDTDRRVLRVWYSGPQRLQKYDSLNQDRFMGGVLTQLFPH